MTIIERAKASLDGDSRVLVQARPANTYRFADDGETPNNPHFPLIHYLSPLNLRDDSDPAAIFETLFANNGWKGSWRDSIYDFLHFHTRTHEVLGIARGTGCVQFGGVRGRPLQVKAGDVIVLPAGTGHRRLTASDDFLVIGAYPIGSEYDEPKPAEVDHDKAIAAIEAITSPDSDPVYGIDGPLRKLWTRA